MSYIIEIKQERWYVMNKKITPKKIIKAVIIFFVALIYISFVVALSFGALTAGIFTVLPAESFGWTVSKPSYLGYYSVCSFAPFSTLILFGMSIVGFFLLIKLGSFIKRKYRTSKVPISLKTASNKL